MAFEYLGGPHVYETGVNGGISGESSDQFSIHAVIFVESFSLAENLRSRIMDVDASNGS